MPKKSATDALKTASKRKKSKDSKSRRVVIKLLIELQEFQKLHHIIVHRQLKMKTIKNYLKKNIRRKPVNY